MSIKNWFGISRQTHVISWWDLAKTHGSAQFSCENSLKLTFGRCRQGAESMYSCLDGVGRVLSPYVDVGGLGRVLSPGIDVGGLDRVLSPCIKL